MYQGKSLEQQARVLGRSDAAEPFFQPSFELLSEEERLRRLRAKIKKARRSATGGPFPDESDVIGEDLREFGIPGPHAKLPTRLRIEVERAGGDAKDHASRTFGTAITVTSASKRERSRTDGFDTTTSNVRGVTSKADPHASRDHDVVKYEEDEDEYGSQRRDSFDARLLRGYNDSVAQLPPAVLREKSTTILTHRDGDPAAGINKSVFTASQELSDILKPRKGVRLRSERGEFPGGSYAHVASRMSMAEYAKLAEHYSSLGSIHATPRDDDKKRKRRAEPSASNTLAIPLEDVRLGGKPHAHSTALGMRSQPEVSGRHPAAHGHAGLAMGEDSSREFLYAQSEIASSIADQ